MPTMRMTTALLRRSLSPIAINPVTIKRPLQGRSERFFNIIYEPNHSSAESSITG